MKPELRRARDMVEWFFDAEFTMPVIVNLTPEDTERVYKQPFNTLPAELQKQIAFNRPFYVNNRYFRRETEDVEEQLAMDAHELMHALTHQHWLNLYNAKNSREEFVFNTLKEGIAMYTEATLSPQGNPWGRNKAMESLDQQKIERDRLSRITTRIEYLLSRGLPTNNIHPYAFGMLLVGTQLENTRDKYKAFDALVAQMPPISAWPNLIDPKVAKIYKVER